MQNKPCLKILPLVSTIFLALMLSVSAGKAADQFPSAPVLMLDTGMHTSPINRIDVDRGERFVVTASDDKTARIWDLKTGRLLSTLRIPIGDGDLGKIYCAAISPDGNSVAMGGWTKLKAFSHRIYILSRKSGELLHVISGLPNVILHLTYSSDGEYLVAMLGAGEGMCAYETESYAQVARDDQYGGERSTWADFDSTGRLVTSCFDGYIRLYDKKFSLIQKKPAPGGKEPFSAVFSPDGRNIAVGYADSFRVDVLAAETLELRYSADVGNVDGTLNATAWSKDGRCLYAAGGYQVSGKRTIRRWSQGGRGGYTEFPLAESTVMGLKPLSNGQLAMGAADPIIAVLSEEGKPIWKRRGAIADFRGQRGEDGIRLSKDGEIVRFGYEAWGESPARFSLKTWQLELNPPEDTDLSASVTKSHDLEITGWDSQSTPKLNGKALDLRKYEWSRSLAIAPDHKSFLLGTEWYLRLFDHKGGQLWRADAPGVAWAVNISNDGRLAVAGYGDGTIRWHRMSDGKELLALFPHKDGKRWIAWTPEGFFAAFKGAESLIVYHLNNGANRIPSIVQISQLYENYHRPDLLMEKLSGNEAAIADALEKVGDARQMLAKGLPPLIGLDGSPPKAVNSQEFDLPIIITDQGGGIGRIEYRINGVLQPELKLKYSKMATPGKVSQTRPLTLNPGTNQIEVTAYTKNTNIASQPLRLLIEANLSKQPPALYGLAIGIEEYRDREFELKYAVDDVEAFIRTLNTYSKRLFTGIEIIPLTNEQATLQGIENAFKELKPRIKRKDVFVLYLSGHGVALGGKYHFLPREFIYTNEQALRDNSLSQEKLTKLLAEVPAQKSLIILDTCQAGSFDPRLVRDSAKGIAEKTAVNHLIRATGRAVLYASSEKKMALEGYQKHSLFTHVLLEGLKGAADRSVAGGAGDKQITIDELAAYLGERVPKLSKSHFNYEMFPMRDMQGQSFPITLLP
jgi:WD40 repeat protein